jgi:hypothetical protein
MLLCTPGAFFTYHHGCFPQVFECWQAWTTMSVFNLPEARLAALDFVQKLAANLRAKDKVGTL